MQLFDTGRGESSPAPPVEPLDGISPIDSLPYEVLADIMVLAVLLPRPGKGGYTTIATPAEVLVFCRICSRWRQVALNTPRLWVRGEFPIPRTKAKSMAVTELFLARSAPLPITVWVYEWTPCHLLPVVVSSAHRWKNFRLYYDRIPAEFNTLFTRIPTGTLENLENLSLRWPNLGSGFDVFQVAPRLREVTLNMRGISLHIPLLPWVQLTHLRLEYESPQACLDILARCTSLVSASVLTDQWREDPVVARRCVLKHLEQLNITMYICSTGEHLAPFLQRLELPGLKSLSLALWDSPGLEEEWFVSWLAPALAHFLARSPRLEYLSVADCIFAEDMPGVLENTPSLTQLHLDLCNTGAVHDDFFLALVHDPAAPVPLAPKLETLELIDAGGDFAEESVVQMLESRWWSDDELDEMSTAPGVARWKRVEFHSQLLAPKFFNQTFSENMKKYELQGLQIWY